MKKRRINRTLYAVLGAVCYSGLSGVETRGAERMWVSSFSNNRIERYSAVSGALHGNLTGGGALIDPLGIAIGPDGHLYVASEGTNQVLRFHRDTGALLGSFVQDNPATPGIDESGGLNNPAAVVFGPDGMLYVSSFEGDAVLRYDGATGAFVDVFVASGSGGLDGPDAGMAFGPGDDLFVPSFWTNEILRYSGADGSFVGAFVSAGSGGLARPRTILFREGDGHMLVTGEGSDSVLLYDGTTGAFLDTFVASIDAPTGMDFGPDGNLYVASIGAANVQRFDGSSGAPLGVFAPAVALPTFLLFVRDAVPDFTQQVQFGAGATIPVAWGDANGDGYADLAVGNNGGGQPNRLYLSNGGVTFTEQSPFGSSDVFAVVWGDSDNDGDLDLAVGNGPQPNALYVNDGAANFTPTAPFGSATTISMAWADYDNDGDLDLAVGNGILGPDPGEQNQLFVNDGGGVFHEEQWFGLGETDSLAWADFDRDGDMDLAVGNGGYNGHEQNYLYVNDGNGNFIGEAQFGMGDTAVVAWGDANNDGWLDLAVGNWESGSSYLYLNNKGTGFTEMPAFGARDTNTLTWGDVDNDGDLDVAVGNGDFVSADQNYLYLNDGDPVSPSFTEVAAFGLGSTDSLALADYDNDGDLDMAVGNEHHPTTNYLYVNNENDGDYLSLRLIGHFHDHGTGYSNRSAVGATVSVYTAGHICDEAYLLGFRQVEAKGGFSAQNSIEVEFGLPGVAAVDIRIDWPGSGGLRIAQELLAVAAGQHLTVDEAPNAPTVDCNGNGLSDTCDVGSGTSDDCNSNGILDVCEVDAGTVDDCSGNGIPDECEPDCNGTGIADSCDILAGTSNDCSGNGIPDECEPDCNDTGIADSCDILAGTSDDCAGEGIPDECEPDCNNTGTADSCDILGGLADDCNGNSVPDSCDLAGGSSPDLNNNGVPDECDSCPFTEAPVFVGPSTGRFLGLAAGNAGRQTAIQVIAVDLPAPHAHLNGATLWLGLPRSVSENGSSVDPIPGFANFTASALQCAALYRDWSTSGTINVYHELLIPGGTYAVRAIDVTCSPADEANYSEPFQVTMGRWADLVGAFDAGGNQWNGPDGSVDVATDVVALLDKFGSSPTSPGKARADLEPSTPDLVINITDVTSALDAFGGAAYPFVPASPGCP